MLLLSLVLSGCGESTALLLLEPPPAGATVQVPKDPPQQEEEEPACGEVEVHVIGVYESFSNRINMHVVKPGRHVKAESETPLNNLFLSMVGVAGHEEKEFGDSTGPLKGLDG